MKEYNTIQGDTWDLIAKNYLGSEYMMSILMESNKDKMKKRIFEGGEKINIPDNNKVKVTINPPWV